MPGRNSVLLAPPAAAIPALPPAVPRLLAALSNLDLTLDLDPLGLGSGVLDPLDSESVATASGGIWSGADGIGKAPCGSSLPSLLVSKLINDRGSWVPGLSSVFVWVMLGSWPAPFNACNLLFAGDAASFSAGGVGGLLPGGWVSEEGAGGGGEDIMSLASNRAVSLLGRHDAASLAPY